jgi:radical SAM protein with 4Fe4S-binding SPASM domain
VQRLAAGDMRGNSLSWRVMDALRTATAIPLYCPAGLGTLAVDAAGGLYPCFMFAGNEEFRLGRFTVEGTITEDRAGQVLPILQACDRGCVEQCQQCWAAPLCSGCIGGDYFETGAATGRASCATILAIAAAVILEVASLGAQAAAPVAG